MKEFWNERYGSEEYIYGKKPNVYFASKLNEILPGTILFPAEGEGRNAVFAAKNDWNVVAFDPSESGKKKANQLAKQNGVTIDYHISDVENFEFQKDYFDALVLIYAHFHSNVRREYHRKLSSFLKKDGVLILEAFSKSHVENQNINPNAGGPQNPEMLYSLEELKEDFNDFEFMEIKEKTTNLKEGKHHLGRANVIQIFAKKR